MGSSSQSNSLQSITDAWGAWFAKNVAKGSGGCVFTASTNYKSVKALANSSKINDYISKYQVVPTVLYTTYLEPTNKSDPTDVVSYSKGFSNGTSMVAQTTQTVSKTTTQTVTFSVTAAVSIGASVTMTAGLPSIAEVDTTQKWEVSLSATGETQQTFQRSWTDSAQISVAPGTAVKLKLIVTEQTATYPWEAPVSLSGCVAIGFKNKVALPNNKNSKNDLYFIPITDVFTQCVQNKIPITGYSINQTANPPAVITTAKGTMTGGGGIASNAYLDELPPDATKPTVVPYTSGATCG